MKKINKIYVYNIFFYIIIKIRVNYNFNFHLYNILIPPFFINLHFLELLYFCVDSLKKFLLDACC